MKAHHLFTLLALANLALASGACTQEAEEEMAPCVGISYEIDPAIQADLRIDRVALTDQGYRKLEFDVPIDEAQDGGVYITCFEPGNSRFDFALYPEDVEQYTVEMAVLPLDLPMLEPGLPCAAESAYDERYFVSFPMKEANYIFVRISSRE